MSKKYLFKIYAVYMHDKTKREYVTYAMWTKKEYRSVCENIQRRLAYRLCSKITIVPVKSAMQSFYAQW